MPRPVFTTATTAQGNSTSVNIAFPASIAAGDGLLLWVTHNVAINTPSGFSLLIDQAFTGYSIALFYKTAVGGETGNLAVTAPSTCIMSIAMERWTGVTTIRNVAVAGGSATTLTFPTQTISSEEVIVNGGGGGTGAGTPPGMAITGSGWTQTAFQAGPGGNNGSVVSARNVTGSGTVSPAGTATWSLNVTSTMSIGIVLSGPNIAPILNSSATGTGPSANVVWGGGVAAGELALLWVMTTTAVSITSDPPTGFTAIGARVSNSGFTQALFYKVTAGGETGSIALTFSASTNWRYAFIRVGNGNPGCFVSQSAPVQGFQANGSTTGPSPGNQPPALTINGSTDSRNLNFSIASIAGSAQATFTESGSWNEYFDLAAFSNSGFAGAYLAGSAPPACQFTASVSLTGGWTNGCFYLSPVQASAGGAGLLLGFPV